MSNEAVNWAYRQCCASAGAKFVLVTLCDFADEQWSCYPSQERIAEMTQMSERAVRGHLASLEKQGFILREKRTNPDGTYRTDRYVIQRQNLPSAESTDGKKRHEPAAESATIQRQNLPPNHHRDPPLRTIKEREQQKQQREPLTRARVRDGPDGGSVVVSIPSDLSPGDEERAQMEALRIPRDWYATKWWSLIQHYETKPHDRRTVETWRQICRRLISEDWAKVLAQQDSQRTPRRS